MNRNMLFEVRPEPFRRDELHCILQLGELMKSSRRRKAEAPEIFPIGWHPACQRACPCRVYCGYREYSGTRSCMSALIAVCTASTDHYCFHMVDWFKLRSRCVACNGGAKSVSWPSCSRQKMRAEKARLAPPEDSFSALRVRAS